ncbi:hypothetical protein BGZ70_002200, partial [Mortierella alpina]
MAPNALVSFDADLMTQTVPCHVFPSDKAASFSAVSDCQSKPVLFSVGQDKILYLLHAENSTGKKPLVNLNKCFGIPDGTVIAHAVNQDQSMQICLVFSTATTLYVVQPTKPDDWTNVKAEDDRTSWLLKGTLDTRLMVKKILMNNQPDEPAYPLLVIGHTDSDGKNFAMSRISMNLASKTWTVQGDILASDEAEDWTSMTCGWLKKSTHSGVQTIQCIFGLGTASNGELFIRILAIDGDFGLGRAPIVTPPGTAAIASFINAENQSDVLLVSTEGLHRYKFHTDGPLSPFPSTVHINNDPIFASAKELRVVQNNDGLALWAESGSNSIVYQQFDHAMVQRTPAVTLLTRQEGGGAFAAHLDPITSSQHLFVVDDNSQMTHLTQDRETRLWQSRPILVPSTDHIEEFTSFTSHINVADINGNALAASTVLLCSSSPTDLAVNGEHLTVGPSPSGVLVKTDSRGNLTIIHRLDDIASVVLTIQDASETSVLGQTYTLNPAKKVLDGLAKITDAASLKSVTFPDGTKLIDSEASPEKIARAGEAIGKLYQHMQSLPPNGSLQSASLNRVSTKNALFDAPSDGSTLWDLWHWLEHEAKSIEKWTVEAVDNAVHWVIKTAEKTFSFVLDCVTHVLKAVGWVLKQVVKDMDKIIQWVGFLFHWDDILAVHSDFVQVVNDILSCAPAAFEVVKENVEAWFGHLKQSIQSLDPESKHITQRYDATSAAALGANTGPINKATQSPGANWSFYQVEHGGVGNSMTAIDKSATEAMNAADNDPFADIWKEIMAALKDMETDLSAFWKDLANNFSSSKSFSLADVFTKAGIDIAVALVDVMQHIVVGFLKVTDLIVSTLKTAIITRLDIPLLSPLYRKINNGKELTILDAISLMIAIPTTVMYKLIHGHNPTSKSSSSPSSLSTTVEPTMFAYTDEITADKKSTKRSAANTVNLTEGVGEVLEKLLTIFKNIPKMYAPQIAIASYNVNIFQVLLAAEGWEEISTSYFQVVKSAIGWLVSIPLPYGSPRPGLGWRFVNFGLGLFTVLSTTSADPAIRGWLGFIVSFLQLVPVSISIHLDDSATKDEYPQRDDVSLVSNSIDRVMNQLAVMLANVCIILMEKDPKIGAVVGAAAITAAVVKLGAQTVSLVKDDDERVMLYG